MTTLPVKGLTEKQLDTVRKLTAHGCKEPLIRATLGDVPMSTWRTLKAPTDDGDPSPLTLALETGHADLAHEVVAFMIGKMRDGDVSAARWLGERVCRFEDPDKRDDAPRVLVVVNAPLSEGEYHKVVNGAED
ncbi:MAG: hypothetical protein ABIK96_00465 [bacterium]